MGKFYLRLLFLFILSFGSTLKTENSFAQCAILETYTSNPIPLNNQYPTSTAVTFCYSLNGFFQYGANWVDGFIIDFGCGWDSNSLTPISAPNSCDGAGQWGFYQSVTSSGTGGTFGPGFFYDRADFFGVLDGNPGNDYGDFTVTGTCEWDLCFSLTVNPTCSCSDLSVSVTAAGDGTVGSWTAQNCSGIPFGISSATCTANCVGFMVTPLGTDPSCFNNDGSINTQISAGTAPFSYLWSANSGSQITPNLSGLSANTYIVTVTDINNCVAVDSVTLVLPPPITTNAVISNASCLSYCNGSITLTPFGGQSPYLYLWSGGLPALNNPNNLCAGTYNVTVTDFNLCTATNSFVVTEPLGMNINMASTSTTCHGGCDGTLTATVSLGTPPYNLLWPNGSINNSVSGICGGGYNVSVTDANGCTLLGNGIVSEPPAINIIPHVHNVTCTNLSDGWINITQQFASLPYNVIWSTGGITDTIKNLVAGNYAVTLTDVNGCTGNSNATVNEPLPLSLSIVSSPTSCPLSSDGIISVISSGGTPQYMYEWINPPGYSTPIVSNLPVGTYEVVVSDANGCTSSISDSIHSNLLFTVNAYGDTVIVNENSTTIGVTLTQPGNYTYIWTPESSVSYPYSSATIVTPSYTTTYTVVVTENTSGCFNSDSVVVIVLPTSYIFIPNAFTPNADGINDLFQLIKGEIVTISDVQIHNRWGQIVYRHPELNWDGTNLDGKPCAIGAYVYYIVYTIQGDPTIYRKQGNVTLVR